MRERRRVVEKRSQKTEENTSIRVRPVWNEMLEPDGSVEQKIIWQYLIVSEFTVSCCSIPSKQLRHYFVLTIASVWRLYV